MNEEELKKLAAKRLQKVVHECGYEADGTMVFCPRCGKKIIEVVRSINEIKAMMKMIQNEMSSRHMSGNMALAAFSFITPIMFTLEWAMGNQGPSPLDITKKFLEIPEPPPPPPQGRRHGPLQ